MWIGGAVLIVGLIGGAIYMIMQNNDASKFEHDQAEQNDTELTEREPTQAPTHHHAHNPAPVSHHSHHDVHAH